MTAALLEYVIEQLQAAKGCWPRIAAATSISKRTLEKIASGEINDPGVRKIEILARYFRDGRGGSNGRNQPPPATEPERQPG